MEGDWPAGLCASTNMVELEACSSCSKWPVSEPYCMFLEVYEKLQALRCACCPSCGQSRLCSRGAQLAVIALTHQCLDKSALAICLMSNNEDSWGIKAFVETCSPQLVQPSN